MGPQANKQTMVWVYKFMYVCMIEVRVGMFVVSVSRWIWEVIVICVQLIQTEIKYEIGKFI
jgi:hypothetical protein